MARIAFQSHLSMVTAVAMIAGCHTFAPASVRKAQLGLTLPAALGERGGVDWSTPHVTGVTLANRRQSDIKRRLQAYPSASAGGWTASGLTLSGNVTNGPAAVFPGGSTPASLNNKIFAITSTGRFYKLDRTSTSVATMVDLNDNFTQTAITLSPDCSRAYVLSDDGEFWVINTITMAAFKADTLSNAMGIAPTYDPFQSSTTGAYDAVYIAQNNGEIRRYTVARNTTALGFAVTQNGTFNVATVSPMTGSRRLVSPPIVLNGVIYCGDMAGYFRQYDTATNTNTATFIGAPVFATPVLDFGLSDVPESAFVTAGASCAWINLLTGDVTFSRPLLIDDGDSTQVSGALLDYTPSASGTWEYLCPKDSVTINTESPDRVLPSTSPASIRTQGFLCAADTNFQTAGTATQGGPSVGYLRFQSGVTSLQAGKVYSKAYLSILSLDTAWSKVPEIRWSSPYANVPGPNTLWTGASLVNSGASNVRPAYDAGNLGKLYGATINAKGNLNYSTTNFTVFDITSAFSGLTPGAQQHFGLAMVSNDGGNSFYPFGSAVSPGRGNNTQTEATRFYTDAANTSAPNMAGLTLTNGIATAPVSNLERRPVLQLYIPPSSMASSAIETSPIIDPFNKKAYVFYSNCLFTLNYASTTAWADTDSTGANKYTKMVSTNLGDVSNGGGGTYTIAGTKYFAQNDSNPVMNYTGTAAYMLDRYPDGPNTKHWFNKVTLGYDDTDRLANRKQASVPRYTNQSVQPSRYIIVDPFSASASGGNLYYGMGSKIYQYDQ